MTAGRARIERLLVVARHWAPVATRVAIALVAIAALAAVGRALGAGNPASAALPPALGSALAVASASPPANEAPAAEAVDAPADAGPPGPQKVALNQADEAELCKLPGVGPSRARAVLALRQRLGRLRSVDDLLRVKGIGRKLVARLRPLVVLDRDGADAGTVDARAP